MIHVAGHKCVFRAPYYPVDSAIEHLFNTIQYSIRLSMYHINNHQDVVDEFNAVMRSMRDFSEYFAHVGIN